MNVREELVFSQLNDGACRTYFVGSSLTRDAALVDPVLGSTDRYLRHLAEGGWTLRVVIDTHTHADHLSGGRLLAERTGAQYAMHPRAGSRHVSLRLSDGASLKLGGVPIEAIETPGHTRDSLSLRIPGRILTGDWLFIGGAGRSDLPGGDPGEHWDSLTRVVPSLDASTLVLPGHDYAGRTESTLSAERAGNPNLSPRSRTDYVSWARAAARPTPGWMIETLRLNNEGTRDTGLVLAPSDAPAACACAPAPGGAAPPPAGPEWSVDELKRQLDAGERPFLLDVRQPEEFTGELGHVPGAQLIPLGELPSRLGEIALRKHETVVTICRSGARSARAAALLREAGFTEVVNMAGGTLAWRRQGFPLER
jgi:glyoxylase-like metal-dependent hydrolase (beta-lactamase superfamily II)/rhodanese-related sulfurtransferase